MSLVKSIIVINSYKNKVVISLGFLGSIFDFHSSLSDFYFFRTRVFAKENGVETVQNKSSAVVVESNFESSK